jgi:hypothetical protein
MFKSTQEKPQIDRPDSPGLYLLFAGRHGHPAHGVGSLVAAYACAEEARAAFRQARLQLSDREGWAELTMVADGTRVKRVCWFGAVPGPIDPHPAWLSAPDRGVGTARGGAPRRPLPFRRRRRFTPAPR